jgi:hypothetical protein
MYLLPISPPFTPDVYGDFSNLRVSKPSNDIMIWSDRLTWGQSVRITEHNSTFVVCRNEILVYSR